MNVKFLEILVCPICKGHLDYHPDKQELVCKADRLAFPITDGIPMMLEEKARQLEEGDEKKDIPHG